jgi:tRNA A-37 threonylcarbamoyl transferase component Bud32/tetratricopeptide (TPR) repeat protein
VTDEPEAIIDRCFAELQQNSPADAVLTELRTIEGIVSAPATKARLLQARAIAANRLGFAGEALGDLHEAARLLEPVLGSASEPTDLPKIFRTIAVVHGWRGESREAALALLRAIAEASSAKDLAEISLALIEAGRLQMEIGHPHDAAALLQRGLDGSDALLPQRERQRAWVTLLQARVATGKREATQAMLADRDHALRDAPARLQLLARVEEARFCRCGPEAEAALASARALAPEDAAAFEHVEIAQAHAEIRLAEKNAAAASEILNEVIARYADDDLASREVVARLMQAQALDANGETDEADRMLAAALRRALDRGLAGYADEARSRLTARGATERVSFGDEASSQKARSAADRFVRRRPIGAGGFAAVMRAYDLELGAEVALKKSVLENVYDQAKRNRLLQAARIELAAAARISHPGVARVHGLLTEDNGDVLLVEEFIDGISLRQAMAAPIERQRALRILSRIAFAIAAVHGAGILHRDIKPENILLRRDDAPVVVDFGIALLSGKSQRAARAGTPVYMSPEQARGDALDERSDLYSLALVACELLLGELPSITTGTLAGAWMSGLGMRALRAKLEQKGLPPPLAQLLARSLSPLRRWRPPSVAQVGRALATASDEQP